MGRMGERSRTKKELGDELNPRIENGKAKQNTGTIHSECN